MALIIAGERSGVGKTTVTLALLSALRQRGLQVQSFKVGPDYIDPMFHRYVTGRACRNLDPVLTSEAYVQQCFDRHAQTATHALVEGVMGLFDGAAGQDDASTAHIARLLDLPVLLVLNCGGMSASIAALVHGYRSFDPRLKFAGVVLNRVASDRHLALLKAALEPLHIPILGVLRREDGIAIPDRHLGLIPTAELQNLDTVVEQLASLGETCFDWTQVMPLLESQRSAISHQRSAISDQPSAISYREARLSKVATPLLTQNSLATRREALLKIQNISFGDASRTKLKTQNSKPKTQHSTLNTLPPHPTPIRIAIAQDAAFSFYYADNLDLLEALGAELVPWSPMNDRTLPEGTQGLYFGGGFPEVFAAQLAENKAARRAVWAAIQAGMPTYAECGGLMYFCETITNFESQVFPMVGVLPTAAVMSKKLTLGYRQAIAVQDGLMLPQNASIWGHEFHRSHLTQAPIAPVFSLHPTPFNPHPTTEGWHRPNLHAAYLHLHWGTRPEIPARFLQHCIQFTPATIEPLHPSISL